MHPYEQLCLPNQCHSPPHTRLPLLQYRTCPWKPLQSALAEDQAAEEEEEEEAYSTLVEVVEAIVQWGKLTG